MDWYFAVLKNYTGFSGRARRREYWTFFVINTGLVLILMMVDIAAGMYSRELHLGVFSGTYTALALLPSLAVCVRRLHDINRSGLWLLLAFVPFLGIALVVMYCLEGTRGDNDYGPDPKPADLDYAPPKPQRLEFPEAPPFPGQQPPPPPPQN